ncbi:MULTISPECIES: recombinase family protein [unclassified Thalassospira]|uniref:recombinase family protein n=1 Tax=unclassified Thalassospira TaxID=2648997 RepID=UPI000C5AC934|nr:MULTISPECIES: recombinase family protein [unclassified Thalassospira]MBC45054.1 DNA invertase [Thalassospira sp.]HAI29623.1 DNA invertase [Thalassospira sp.]|tara:strand:+ start:158 stop:715 length:558 start_codon:yes stop_codon:yes gene_type:complete
MLVGYARTSTLDQKASIEVQVRDLIDLGCEKVFKEQVSSVDVKNREQLALALDFIREGDTLVVTKLDRLARSTAHLVDIMQTIEAKKAGLRIVDLGVDTGTATGRLMLNVVSAIAQFEREIMLERQREGIEKARREGKYKGRPTEIDPDKVRAMKDAGKSPTTIAKELRIARSSVYRVLESLGAD